MSMLVKTINPVVVNHKKESEPSKYLSFNGKTATTSQLIAFKKFANSKGYTPTLSINSKFDSNTKKAISQYGDAFDDLIATAMGLSKKPLPTPSASEQAEQAKKGKIWDKLKGWVSSGKAESALGTAKGLYGTLFGNTSNTPDVPTDNSAVDTGSASQPTPAGSSNKKIILIGGGILVLGIIIFAVTRSKK